LIVKRRVSGTRFVLLISVVFCAGCGSEPISDITEFSDLQPVSGKVMFQGRPIAGGSVRLHSATAQADNGQMDVHTGIVGEDGTFEVHTFRAAGRGLGVPTGDYFLSFSWPGVDEGKQDVSRDELPERLPTKFTRPQTSGIKASVLQGGSVVPDIDLK
jgi:hypothetical protein